jgi:uncharacterized protein (DUF4213/DUF364 family)
MSPAATSHNIDLPTAEFLLAIADSIARIEESLGVSQVSAMSLAQI